MEDATEVGTSFKEWLQGSTRRLTMAEVQQMSDSALIDLASMPTWTREYLLPLEMSASDWYVEFSKLVTTKVGLVGREVKRASTFNLNIWEELEVDGEWLRISFGPWNWNEEYFVVPMEGATHEYNVANFKEKAAERANQFVKSRSDYRKGGYLKELQRITKAHQRYCKVFGLPVEALLEPKLDRKIKTRLALAKLRADEET